MTMYRKVNIDIAKADEQCLQDVLEEVLETVNMPEKAFQEALNLYMAEASKQEILQRVNQEATVDNQEGIAAEERKTESTMSVTEAVAGQKQLQALSIKLIKDLKALPQQQMSEEQPILASKLEDLLFGQTGLELEDLIRNTHELNLEDNEEYQTSLKEYTDQMEALQK